MSTKTCANISVFWFMALSHHLKRDPTSGPCLLVTYSEHVKHIQLKPTKLKSHTALVKLPMHRGTTAEQRRHNCILVDSWPSCRTEGLHLN